MSNQERSDGKVKGTKDGEDLTTILNASQRADLTMLVANITESMRDSICENFDAEAGLDKSLFGNRDNMTNDEKMMALDPSKADVDEYEKQRKVKEIYEKDLKTPKTKKLKQNCLKAFDDWREKVILRVGEVVNSREKAKEQLDKLKPTTPTRSVGKIIQTPDRISKLRFKDLYPPTSNPLTKLSMNERTLVLHSLLLLLLSLEQYNAPSRILMLLLTSSFKLPLRTFEQDEYATAKGLLEGIKELTAEDETKKKVEENKDSRKWKVGLATAAGAAVIGVAGGLAAPLVAAGVGSVMGGLGLGATSAAAYLGSVAGSTYLVGGLFGAYGGRMTGQMMDNYAREVEDFEFLPVHSNNKTSEDDKQGPKQASDHDHKLRVTICISGWLTEKEEVVKPWAVLGTGAEVFALKYELEALLNLGNAMNGLVQSAAWGYAQRQLIARTVFADLATAMWPIGLIAAARVIDNPFNVAKSRSEKAGEVLADALINKAQGERPVTLIGYSLGARVIYTCLMSLAKRKAFGLVENAVLFGAPTPSDTSDWRILRSVVTGRLVNVYSENDYVLGFMYRTSSLQYGVAGLQAVQGLPNVENVCVSDEVTGHLRYRFLIGSILKKIGFEDVNMQAVEAEREALTKMQAQEEKESLNAQRKRLMHRESTGGKADEKAEADQEASEIEKSIKEKTQKSLVTRAFEYFYTPTLAKPEDIEKMGRNVQKATQNPSQVGELATESAKDAQKSVQTIAQRAYQALPSMPYLSSGNSVDQKASSPVKEGSSKPRIDTVDTKTAADSYVSKAVEYLPSMPKNLPSMPKKLPSMPTLGRSKQPPQTKPAKLADNVTDVGGDGASKVASVAQESLQPTVKNIANVQDNPAIGTLKENAKKAPVIHQAIKPIEKSADAAGKAMDNTTEAGVKTGTDALGKVTDAAKSATSTTLDADQSGATKEASEEGVTKDKKEEQTYVGYAASYLPSMPTWRGTPKAPGLERKASDSVKSPPPKLERRRTSQQQLENKRRDSAKSSPRKLGPSRANSGIKSPPAKLSRLPSGLKKQPSN